MSHFCASCRAVLRHRASRLGHARRGHRVVDLEDRAARASLLDPAVVGRASGRPFSFAVLFGLGLGVLGFIVGLRAVWDMGALARTVYAAGVVLVLGAGAVGIVGRRGERQRRGHGGPEQAAGTVISGVVVGDDELTAPVSGRSCVAYGVRLMTGENAPRLVLEEQLSSGFRLQTAHGEVLIDPGAVVLAGSWHKMETRHLSNDLVRYLVQVDPLRADARLGAEDPFLWESAEELVIAAGDRVSLHSGTKLRELQEEAGLRAPARMVVTAVEEPTLELLPDQGITGRM